MSLESSTPPLATLSRWNVARDVYTYVWTTRFSASTNASSRGDNVARTTSRENETCHRTVLSVFRYRHEHRRGSRRHYSTTVAVQREIGISARQRIPGPFTTGTSGTPVLSFGQHWRSVPFRVCLHDRSPAIGLNVYTRSMFPPLFVSD